MRFIKHAGVILRELWWVILIVAVVGVVSIKLVILLCLHACHLRIKRKLQEVKNLQTTVEQNEAYGLPLRRQQRVLSQTNVVYDTVQEQLIDGVQTKITEAEYDYIDSYDLPQMNSTDFAIENNQSYATVEIH